jgi:hypothetical protein
MSALVPATLISASEFIRAHICSSCRRRFSRSSRSGFPSIFLQPTHRQRESHTTIAWKHSQYFFKHALFLQ